MEIKEVLANIQGVDEKFATLILKFIDNYINMSSNKTTVTNNLLQQIEKMLKSLVLKV